MTKVDESKINTLPYMIKNIIENRISLDDVIAINNITSTLNEWLLNNGYMELVEEKEKNSLYKSTELLKQSSFEDILFKMTGLTYEEYKLKKVVSFKDLHLNSIYEFEDLIDCLNDVDGYFDKVNIDSLELKSSLIMHELCGEAGPNGYSVYGKESLKKYVKENNYEEIFKLITGQTYNDFQKYLEELLIERELKELTYLAEKYNYVLIKKEDNK